MCIFKIKIFCRLNFNNCNVLEGYLVDIFLFEVYEVLVGIKFNIYRCERLCFLESDKMTMNDMICDL